MGVKVAASAFIYSALALTLKPASIMSHVDGPHRYPGEYTYKGVVYTPQFCIENLQWIEDHLQFGTDDVLVATYPKSGKIIYIYYFLSQKW